MINSSLKIIGCTLCFLLVFNGAHSGYAQPKIFTNSIEMEFILIPAGSFMMGTDCQEDNPFTEKNEYAECDHKVEHPKHEIVISEPFYISKYEVTQLQWYLIMDKNPANFKTEKVGMDSRHHPVEMVSWDDVQEFIRKLNKKEGTNAYRLPSEAEWEYAARAGTDTEYFFGNDPHRLKEYAWYVENSKAKTNQVGTLKPNSWGLYDMYGNVWEWCLDWYDGAYYSKSPSENPPGPNSGTNRVLRGGSWSSLARICRSAYRHAAAPDSHDDSFGFRLVKIP
jgi:formylglycine-generating enzyme required for sulfatase activity